MHFPTATWRAQFTPDWGFDDAAALAGFLSELGISDLYASPILEARTGSTHGYDITDPTRIRDELGGARAFDRLTEALQQRGIGIILDIVPNHMAADQGNPWWWDVLENGPASPYAGHFDIDWAAGGGKVLLPILGKPLPDAIAAGELTIAPRSSTDDTPTLHYYDRQFPLTPASRHAAADLRKILGDQHYQLVYWHGGLKILNYRRFFDIADLISIRVEQPVVFDDAHRLILDLLRRTRIRGLRIDHIDGLHSPKAYLDRLRKAATPDLSRGPDRPSPYIIVEKILAHDERLPGDWPIQGDSGYEFLSHLNTLFVDPNGAALIEADAHQRLSAAPAFAAEARNSKRFVIRELFEAETDRLIATLEELARLDGRALSRDNLLEALIETTASMRVYRTYIAPGGPSPSPEDTRRLTEALDAAAANAAQNGATWQPELAFLRDLLLDRPSAPRELHASFMARFQQFTGPVMAKGVEDTALYRRITLASLNDVGCDPDDLPADPASAFHEYCIERQRRSPASLSATATHDTKRGEDTRLRISTLASMAPDYLAALDRWFEQHGPIRAALPGGPAPRPADEALIYQSLLGIWPSESAGAEALEPIAARLSEYMIKAAREAKLRSSWHDPDQQYEEALRRFIHALVTGPEGARFREDSRPMRERMMAAAAVHSLSQVVIKCTAPGIPDFYRGTELWDLSLVDPDNRRPVDFELRQSLLAILHRAMETDPQEHMNLLAQLMESDGPLGWRIGAIKMYTMMRTLDVRNRRADLFQRGEYLPLSLHGNTAPRLFAFARQLHDQWVIALVPRLVEPSMIIPLGEHWADASLELPPMAPNRWRNAMLPGASEPVVSRAVGNNPQLAVADVLRFFPTALLTPA